MSVTWAKCASCGKRLFYKFGSISYEIVKTVHKKSCNSCGESLSDKESFLFCNKTCLKKWLRPKKKKVKKIVEEVIYNGTPTDEWVIL